MKRSSPEWKQMTKRFTGLDLLSFRVLTSWATLVLLLAICLLSMSR